MLHRRPPTPCSRAGAISVNKKVKAEGSDQLGVIIDPLATAQSCAADADGFYSRPCVPIAEPGGDVTWRWEFVNTGNRPIDRILGIDRLPAPGDAVATAPILARGSQWQPLLTGTRPALIGPGTINVYYTTATSGWCDQPQAADGELLCGALNWVEWPAGQPLPVDPATVTGLQVEVLPDGAPLPPAGTIDLDVAMTAPAYSPADTPNTESATDAETIAFNSVGIRRPLDHRREHRVHADHRTTPRRRRARARPPPAHQDHRRRRRRPVRTRQLRGHAVLHLGGITGPAAAGCRRADPDR